MITDDSAHRAEHSIEIDLLILQYVYGASEFTLIPILVSGFHSFMTAQTDPFEHEKIASFVKSIQSYAKAEHKSVLFVSSGDLSHRGVKFGDDFHAQDHIQETALYDTGLIDSLCAGDAKGFYKHIADCKDQYRICGCSPNIMLLQTMESAKEKCFHINGGINPKHHQELVFVRLPILMKYRLLHQVKILFQIQSKIESYTLMSLWLFLFSEA